MKKKKVSPKAKVVIKKEEKYQEIRIPVLSGTFIDLGQFDFSFKDITIYDIESKEFDEYLKRIEGHPAGDQIGFFKDIKKTVSSHNKKYAVVKNDPFTNYDYSNLVKVYYFLLIIFPSDLQMEYEVHYDYMDGKFDTGVMSTWDKRITGDYPGKRLYADPKTIPEINRFIRGHFDKLRFSNYIGFVVENYLTSFNASHLHYRYLTLCIALEATISGTHELSYRLKRTIAILCGEAAFHSDLIFTNLGKIYDLRSKIVHGSKYSIAKVDEYLEPLQSIVSRTIVELLIHNIVSSQDLNNIITQLGFGDRDKISENWSAYILNIIVWSECNYKILK